MNHYFVPIGYEYTNPNPKCAYDSGMYNLYLPKTALMALVVISDESEMWMCIGDTSKTSPPLHCVKFEWVNMDMMCDGPYHVNMYVDHPQPSLLWPK